MDFKSFVRAQDAGAKAIVAHPALLSDDPVITVRGLEGANRRVAFGQREAGRHLSAYGGKSDAIDWVMNCVKLISETASEADWHFEKDGERYVNFKDPLAPKASKLAPLAVVNLFEEPNPYMNWSEHIELTIIDYLLTGNAYWLHWRQNEAGQPLALYRLSPALIKVVPGQFGVDFYEYQLPEMKEPMRIPPSEMTHFRQANPHNQHFGLGHIQGAARMLDSEIALTDTLAAYFEKAAQPSMVVQSDRRVPDAVFRKLKGQLRAMYSGPKNAGNLMVLEAGLKYQAVSPTAAQAGFENLSKLSRDRILSLFRVPPALLGIQEVGDAKINESQRVFDTKTMRPLLDKMQKVISRTVSQAWDLDFVIEYTYIMPIEERLKLTQSFASIPGVRVREVREYAGLPLLGDDNDDLILNLPGEEVPEGYHPEIADRNLEGEGGRPPNGENTALFPKDGEPLPKGAKVRRPGAKALTLSEISDRLEILAIEKKAVTFEPADRTDIEKRIIAPDDVTKADREDAIDGIAAALERELADASHDLERALLDHVEGKAGGTTLYQRIKKSQGWKAFEDRITSALHEANKRALSQAAIDQGRLGIKPDEPMDYDAISKQLIYDRKIGGKAITETLRKKVADKVLAIQRKQGTRLEFEEVVREDMSNFQGGHASTVALTNLTHAYNEGVLTLAELNGDDRVFVHDGDQDDEPCIAANGSVWTVAEARERRLEHPRCRRGFTILPSATIPAGR